jgi:hypothetical protein
MYQQMWGEREFPKEWRRATVIPTSKPKKTQQTRKATDPRTSCPCKILDRIVKKKLESKILLPEEQYGFRKGRSTTDVLIILENNIAEVFRKK